MLDRREAPGGVAGVGASPPPVLTGNSISTLPESYGVTDDYDNTSKTSVILNGSPVAGVTIDYEQDLTAEDKGGDSNVDTLNSPTPNSDTETDVFSNHDDITETGEEELGIQSHLHAIWAW